MHCRCLLQTRQDGGLARSASSESISDIIGAGVHLFSRNASRASSPTGGTRSPSPSPRPCRSPSPLGRLDANEKERAAAVGGVAALARSKLGTADREEQVGALAVKQQAAPGLALDEPASLHAHS